MLNKKSIKQKKLMEVCHDLPALVAFMFLFQVEVVAQEKYKKNTRIQTQVHQLQLKLYSKIVSKNETVIVATEKNEGVDTNTEIYINGKKK
jgi:hypothetical protein